MVVWVSDLSPSIAHLRTSAQSVPPSLSTSAHHTSSRQSIPYNTLVSPNEALSTSTLASITFTNARCLRKLKQSLLQCPDQAWLLSVSSQNASTWLRVTPLRSVFNTSRNPVHLKIGGWAFRFASLVLCPTKALEVHHALIIA